MHGYYDNSEKLFARSCCYFASITISRNSRHDLQHVFSSFSRIPIILIFISVPEELIICLFFSIYIWLQCIVGIIKLVWRRERKKGKSWSFSLVGKVVSCERYAPFEVAHVYLAAFSSSSSLSFLFHHHITPTLRAWWLVTILVKKNSPFPGLLGKYESSRRRLM